jgi:PDZ domain-containing protein
MTGFDDDSLERPPGHEVEPLGPAVFTGYEAGEVRGEGAETSEPWSDPPGGLAEIPPPIDAPAAPPTGRHKTWTKGRVVLAVVGFVAVAAIVCSFISVPYYALTPGSAQNVGALIEVPGALEHGHTGTVNLVDVEETPLRLIDFPFYWLDDQATIYSSQALQGDQSNSQYYTEGVVDMADAQQAAAVVALHELGYPVTVREDGILAYAIDPGSPAAANLVVGDVISALDSTQTLSQQSFSAALSGRKPGDSVTLRVTPYSSSNEQNLFTGKPLATLAARSVTVKLGAWRLQGKGSNAAPHCAPTNVATNEPLLGVNSQGGFFVPAKGQKVTPIACLGLLDVYQSYYVSKLPFKINLNSEGIIGPSAGLAFTLGLIQKLDEADITGGHKIACTGTMSITGQIGAIGGVEQKTFAVRNAGATIFLVPQANYAEAKKYAGSQLKVYAVNTIQQAISILEANGGRIVKPTGNP